MKRFLIFLLISACIFNVAAHFLPICYEDNDDASMAWIASGTYSGEPDCHLQYINACYGLLLNKMYSLVPDVEWYSVLFALFHIIAFSIICCYILKAFSESKLLSIIVILSALCIWMWVIVRFQFTTTAAILAFSAILLLLDKRFWVGGILLVIAGTIRFSAAGLVGLIMAPFLFYHYGRDIKKCWLPLVLVLSAVLVFRAADEMFYKSPEWDRYREFDSYRGKINDNPNDWRARGHLPSGMADVNYEMILSYFVDPTAVSNQEMEAIVSYLYKNVPLRKNIMNSYRGCFKKYWKWFLFVFLALLPVLVMKEDKKFRWTIFISYCVWFASLSLLAFQCSVKNRVFTTSFIAMAFYFTATMSRMSRQGKLNFATILCSIFCLFCVLEYAIPACKRGAALQGKAEKFKEQLELVNSIQDYSVVTNGGDFSVEMLNPFKMSNAIKPRVFVNPYCYMASPLNNDRLSSHLDLTKNDICMLTRKDCGDFALLRKAIMNNYGVAVDTVHFAESTNYYLIKFVKAE